MNLVEEYRNQSNWRDWGSYIKRLPVNQQDVILDLGCSIGAVSKLLAEKAHHVVGIDNNPELLKEAERINRAENISFLNMDLRSTACRELSLFNGIWSSFVAAYFPDFEPVLNDWISVLKPGGWIALVEMSDLFSHEPVSRFTRDTFESYSVRQCRNNTYDFKMGVKLKDYVHSCGLSIIYEEDMSDRELTFNGPAEAEILKSWESRLDRMHQFIEYAGKKDFHRIRDDFMNGLSDPNHTSHSTVKFIVAKKHPEQ
jgi:SAM-dependent methyltransferase